MIRKLVRQMLTAQIFSALTVSLCLLIDNVMISRFLGKEGIAAYGLANPLLLAIGAIGSLLASGIQVVCSKSLGRGSQTETNAGYSSAVAVAGGVSLVFMAAVLLFTPSFARLMGAGRSGKLFDWTRDYLAGFSIGAPASMGALVLVPFLQMAGQSKLLITAVLAMTVIDVGLDLLNALVFHGGMFGMGLASAVSYYAAMIISAFYFLSKKCVFRFSFRQVTGKKITELFASGFPASFGMAATVLLVFLMNRMLMGLGGQNALASFTVINTIGNSACCIVTGIGGISLTLCGVFYNEEDRTALYGLLRLLYRYAVFLGLCMGAVLLVFAPALVSVFIPGADEAREMAVLGLRIYAAGLIPCCLNASLKNAYQATGRVLMTEAISLLEGALLPALAAFVLSRFLGVTGAWLFFPAGGLLTMLLIGLYVRARTGRIPWKPENYLLLRDDFGVPPEDLMEADIHSLEEVAAVSRQAEEFCISRGQSPRLANHIALCIEEMADNTVRYGFSGDGKNHDLSVRILRKPDHWIVRFRDDCPAFDPVHYIPQEEKPSVGIRLVLALAEEAKYTYSLNMNHLVLRIPCDE